MGSLGCLAVTVGRAITVVSFRFSLVYDRLDVDAPVPHEWLLSLFWVYRAC